MKIQVVIPFRLRENADPRRAANLEVVQAWWYSHGYTPQIVSDGLTGDAQFNRHRAYNRAVEMFPETDVFVFTEADMLLPPQQVRIACEIAQNHPGLVVPFTQYRYLSDAMTEIVRDAYHDLATSNLVDWWTKPVNDPTSIFSLTPEYTMDNGKSIGAVNVVSAKTLRMTGGFTEATTGNWYDDRIIEQGFAFLTSNPTRYCEGPAVHLYHLPGHKGDHLSEADIAATAHNKQILNQMRSLIRHHRGNDVRNLMQVRR